MLEKLKRLLSGRPLKNEAALSSAQLDLLAADLGKLTKVQRGFSQRALYWVVDGDDGGFLLELAGQRGGGDALKLICASMYGFYPGSERQRGRRRRLLGGLARSQAAVALRLAQVYEAASRPGRQNLTLGWLGAPAWLDVFLQEVRAAYTYQEGVGAPVAARLIEGMLAADSADPALAARGALLADPQDWAAESSRGMFTILTDLGETIARHPEVVREALARPARVKVEALEVMRRSRVDPEPFLDPLTDLAVGSAKTVRAAAEPLLRDVGDEALDALRSKAEEGTAGERDHAVRLLWKLDEVAARPFLEERRRQDKSKKVRQTLDQLLAGPAASPAAGGADAVSFDLPPVPEIDADAPLPDETRDALRQLCTEWSAAAAGRYRKGKERGHSYLQRPPTLSRRHADRAFRQLGNWVRGKPGKPIELRPRWGWDGGDFNQRIKTFIERPELGIVHFARLLVLLRSIEPDWSPKQPLHQAFQPHLDHYARLYRKSHPPAFGLRELAAALGAIGVDDHLLGWARLRGARWWSAFHWEAEAVWPYFAERLEILEEVFDLRPTTTPVEDYWRGDVRRNAFEVLAMFPVLPPVFHNPLWEVALGTSKTERPLAQAALDRVPGREERILAALASGKQDVRAAAALWLGRIGAKDTVPALEAALEREKRDVAKGAFLTALEALGVPAERFLDRDGLRDEAVKGLAKGVPAGLAWFPFDLLPAVHWADSGAPVAPEIVRWFVVQSTRLKSPEPGPLLRRYCAAWESGERQAVGQFVLDAWIAHDTVTPTVDEVGDEIRQRARAVKRFYKGETEEQVYRRLLAEALNQCQGSAIKEKGVLAVAAACCGAPAAAPVERYLKRWYGMRAGQCKALLRMLSWIDHPAASQLLLSVANRFRTAGIRKEAETISKVLAERRGWTVAELADRTVPDAGFAVADDENRVDAEGKARQVFDLGERRFTATLDDQLAVVLTNPAGKAVKAVPAARKGESAEVVKKARKRLSAARKELKAVVQLQRQRLYEAMCTQRSWPVADWRTYLAGHPIVGRFCRRLVWAGFEPVAGADDEAGSPTPAVTFRPLADGSLTDAVDQEVVLGEELSIRLAHDCNTPPETAGEWLAHLEDYEVEPLFVQFGRQGFRLPEERADDTELEDFKGHLLEAFQLRGQALKLGYLRAPAEDGGWFYSYRKPFPTLELEAIVEFTGNYLPEENRTVALRSLSFDRTSEEEEGVDLWDRQGLRLGDIPPVLLGECWNDLRTLAALGPGYDPEWEKKTEY